MLSDGVSGSSCLTLTVGNGVESGLGRESVMSDDGCGTALSGWGSFGSKEGRNSTDGYRGRVMLGVLGIGFGSADNAVGGSSFVPMETKGFAAWDDD